MSWRIVDCRMGRMVVSGLLLVMLGVLGAPVGIGPIPPGAKGPRIGFGVRPNVTYRDATSSDHFFPVNVNNSWGYASQGGDLLVYPLYQWTDYFYDDLARVVSHGKTGFMSRAKVFIIPTKYAYADRFQDGMAIIGDGKGHYSYINRADQMILPMRLDGALRFTHDVAAVQVGNKIGYINKTGGVVAAAQFAKGRAFHQNYAMVELFAANGTPGTPGVWAAINRTGNIVWRDKAHRFDFLGSFYDGFAKARVGKRWGYIGRTFHLRIPARYENARRFSNGLAAVEVSGKWGYINKAGQMQIKPQFDKAYEFGDTMAMIELNGKYGYVNKAGTGGIAPAYQNAQPFYNKLARVSIKPSFGYINVAGQVMWNPLSPLNGIVDMSLEGRIGARLPGIHRPGNRIFAPPQPRKAAKPAYPPDYQYVDILPQPGGAFGGSNAGG